MKIAVRYGLIYSAINIVLMLIGYVTGFNRSSVTWPQTILSLGVPVLCIYLAIREHQRTEGNGFVEFGKAFKLGLIISLVAAFITSAFSLIYFRVLDPGLLEFMTSVQIEKMEESGVSDEGIEQALKMTERFNQPFYMFTFGLMGSLFTGSITALIMAAIMKKPNPNTFY
jgi:hypothetical protein